MDGIVPCLVGMAAGIALVVIAFLGWVYDPEGLPPLPVLLEHLRSLRAMVRIMRSSSDALVRMLDEARRPR